MSEMTPELAAEVRALVAEAQTLAADVDEELAAVVERAASEPFTDAEARELFTKIVTAVSPHSDADRRMSDAWPWCRAPMVGTSPTVAPSVRAWSSALRNTSARSITASELTAPRFDVPAPGGCRSCA